MKSRVMVVWLVVAVAGLALLTACAPAGSLSAGAALPVSALITTGSGGSSVAVAPTGPSSALSTSTLLDETEAAGLVYMREEEKLARDVYTVLYARWRMSIFQNIASAEQTHMDAVLNLLNRYGLPDPAKGQAVGKFVNPTLQALYDQLIQQGSASREGALRVGAAIEEIDILDLEERIAQTDQADIQMVYGNLKQGSENHLRAFVSALKNQLGIVYVPQYLSQEAYNQIVSGGTGGGGRRR